MAHTHTRLLYHVVFATKRREPWLTPDVRPAMHAYLAGILDRLGAADGHVGGIADHVHACFALPASVAVADLVRTLKANSSGWFRKAY